MSHHTVAIVGCGPRGRSHAEAFLANPDRFDRVAVCDLDETRLQTVSSELGIENTYADADAMLAAEKPEVFCFCTLPHIRLPMIELGIKHGVKAIAYEKPMATSLAEAEQITTLCAKAGVKTVVSHQHKYGDHWQKAKEIADSGEIGDVHTIHVAAKGRLLEYATHLIDYMIFLNNGARVEWVVGHVHGGEKLGGTHPSPDYAMAQFGFDNGVRGLLDCGALAPDLPGGNSFWLDAGATMYGSDGYAQAIVGSGWRALTKSQGFISGKGGFNVDHDQPLYVRDLADWLDDETKVHPCNGDVTYHGFQAMMAICASALDHQRVELPMRPPEQPLMERMKQELQQHALRLPT